ncbi:MAG: lysophospholipid acyltransferase family protein [Lachnospiraceae bacterium]|nr:lysophospholipid acyltransferase family protein [Lachnospiraceae bacterium]
MIRITLVLGYLFLFLVFTCPYYFIYRKWDKKGMSRKRYESAAKKVHNAFGKCLSLAGADIIVDGLSNIPENQAVLYVGNHSSYFDILALFHEIPGGAGFVAKDDMAKIPLLNKWMTFINCLFINRKDVKEGMTTIKQAAQYLKDGYSMVIFPEGTRNQDPEPHEFKEGSLRIASMAKAPIIPVAISGTADLLENNPGFRTYPATVHITFGNPIYMNDLPRAEKKHLGATIRQWIIDTRKTHIS